jgi:hypothetical protein
MTYYPPRPFFADFIDEFLLVENPHGMGLSTSDEQEVLHFHHSNHDNLDPKISSYLLNRGFVQESRFDNDQYCLITFRATKQEFCACSRIYDPILKSWWYAMFLNRKLT